MNVYLGGQIFQTEDELKCYVLNWLYSQDETFYAAGIRNMPERWKKCIIIGRMP
jgi:hypothetical protein